MSFKQTFEIIESSQAFKNFKTNHPEAELCAGFFILDFLDDSIKKTLDYMINDKVFTFSLNDNNEITIQEDKLLDIPNKPKLTKIKPEVKVELDELKNLAGIESLDQGVKGRFEKIIAVLQNYNHEDKETLIWNLTCMLEGLTILNILIDSETGDIIKFEKKSIMDLIKKE